MRLVGGAAAQGRGTTANPQISNGNTNQTRRGLSSAFYGNKGRHYSRKYLTLLTRNNPDVVQEVCSIVRPLSQWAHWLSGLTICLSWRDPRHMPHGWVRGLLYGSLAWGRFQGPPTGQVSNFLPVRESDLVRIRTEGPRCEGHNMLDHSTS